MNYKVFTFLILLTTLSCKTDSEKVTIESIQLHTEKIKIEPINEKYTKTIINTQNGDTDLKDVLIGKTHKYDISFSNSDLYLNGGGLIDGTYNSKKYSLSTISGKNDITHYVLFQEVTSENNNPTFKIIDVLKIDEEIQNLLSDPKIELYIVMAYKDQVVDEEIIAIANYEDNEVFTKIHKAWRADRKTQKIIEISTEGITVDNVL